MRGKDTRQRQNNGRIVVTKPSTFFTTSKEVLVDDDQHNFFYYHPNKERHLTFNLPPGVYYLNCKVSKLPDFLPYEERTYPDPVILPSQMNLIKYRNKNKASISTKMYKGWYPVIVDPAFWDHEYQPCQTAILGHEMFHGNFNSNGLTESQKKNYFIRQHIEKQCDDAIRNYMLCNGWNPSQISLAFKFMLKGQERRDCIARNTTGKHYRR